jgi:1,6-anhydro-N-acetylmuramate kinase
MPDELSFTLRAFADKDAALTAKQLCEVQRDFCMLHVRAIKSLMEQFHAANPVWATQHSIDLVSVHGQTVYHAPPLYSYQMFTAAPLSHELGMTVVCDLRAADVAAGGQGAPLTPVSDFVLFRDRRSDVDVEESLNVAPETRVVVNLGGICNVTLISPRTEAQACSTAQEVVAQTVKGFDVCVCSQLLDAVARTRLSCAYDEDGANALAGTAVKDVVVIIRESLRKQAIAGRSLGTRDSPTEWIKQFAEVDGRDLAASAVEAVAACIVASFPLQVPGTSTGTSARVRVLLAGGGAKNLALRSAIQSQCEALDASTIVQCTDHADVGSGVGVLMRECCGWAVLGALCMDKEPITIEQTTGVERAPVAGQAKYFYAYLFTLYYQIYQYCCLDAINQFLCIVLLLHERDLVPTE